MKQIYANVEENIKEFTNILDVLRWTATFFSHNDLYYGHGTDNSWDEAMNLVLSSLELPLDVDTNVLVAKLTPQEKSMLAERIKRRVNEKIPVAYIIKEAWFANYNFYVDERVIIPKSPIAELIEEEFRPWVEHESVENILDLCTGSGCIAIATALAFPDAEIDATDLSEEALEIAKINVERHGVDNVNLIKADVFNGVPKKKYDLIISNPPYVSAEEYADIPQEYTFEPKISLLAGQDGLDVVRKILNGAVDYLSETGVLIVEVGSSQYALEEAYPEVPFTWLHFDNGGEGVFMLNYEELREFAHKF